MNDLGNTLGKGPRLIYGCMRIAGDRSAPALEQGKRAVLFAYESGFRQFDHADIYGHGACESLFGEVLREIPGMREEIRITSKCGIRRAGDPTAGDPGRYDFSREYILRSVRGSLQRLGTGYLDTLLLHRPDYLMNPEEVAAAFEELKQSGLVRSFGVSNFTPSQVSLLQHFCPFPLVSHQLEINIHRTEAFRDGTLDQCMMLGMIPEAWSPLKGVAYPVKQEGFNEEGSQRIFRVLQSQADNYGKETWVILLAWLLKHPSGIRPVIGTTQPERIRRSLESLQMEYDRSDWYRLLEARNGFPVP